MKQSWKTTLAGALGALATFFLGVDDLKFVGQLLLAGSTFFLGVSARDNDVSSEQAGAQ